MHRPIFRAHDIGGRFRLPRRRADRRREALRASSDAAACERGVDVLGRAVVVEDRAGMFVSSGPMIVPSSVMTSAPSRSVGGTPASVAVFAGLSPSSHANAARYTRCSTLDLVPASVMTAPP